MPVRGASTNGAVVAQASGVVVLREGNELALVRGSPSSSATLTFVIGLIALIFTTNGVLLLISGLMGDGPLLIGVLLGSIGAGAGTLAWNLHKRAATARRSPPTNAPFIRFDLARRLLLDFDGTVLATLDEVRLMRRMQAFSSDPKLVVAFRDNERTLVQGNPFAGGIAPIVSVLKQAGIPSAF